MDVITEQQGSAAALNALLIGPIDVSSFKEWALQINGTYTGVLTWQGSNDKTNWINLLANQLGSGSNFFPNATNSTGIYTAPVKYRWLQVIMSGYTSGTATGIMELYSQARAIQNVQANMAGNTALVPVTAGGTNDFHLVSTASTNATNIKSSGGQVYGYEIWNAAAAARFVRLFNKATAPVPGTDAPFRTIGVPAGGRASFHTSNGLAMGNGIGIDATAAAADLDATATAAGDLIIDIDWK